MKFIKKFESFLSEEFVAADPLVKPATPEVLPGVEERPAPPSIIPDEQQSDLPAPAKAELPTATAEDVAAVFVELINKSGDDIKKYVEMK
jgi:hypothetical protein